MNTTMQQKISLLNKAIMNHHSVNFDYHGRNRIVNPHFYGINGGVMQLHAFQIGGESEQGGLPDWRNFIIGDIINLKSTDAIFDAPSLGYNPNGTHYTKIDFQI